jgi:hypothetical protein
MSVATAIVIAVAIIACVYLVGFVLVATVFRKLWRDF